jgi:hypothetical protein
LHIIIIIIIIIVDRLSEAYFGKVIAFVTFDSFILLDFDLGHEVAIATGCWDGDDNRRC